MPSGDGYVELLEDPVDPYDPATKQYVDQLYEGAETPEGYDGGKEIDPDDPDDAPSNVALVGAARTATVVWESMNVGGLGGYDVQVDSTNLFDSEGLREVSVRGTNASFGDLLPGNVYYARVRAIDASGNISQWSDIVTATVLEIGETDVEDGAISGDKLSADALDNRTATGTTLRSDEDGLRVEIDASNHRVVFYDDADDQVAAIHYDNGHLRIDTTALVIASSPIHVGSDQDDDELWTKQQVQDWVSANFQSK